MDKIERGTMLKKCALIVGGAVLYAAGMGLFLSPNHLAPGGVTGIAVILNSAFGLPTGITAFVLNIPLFLIAIKAFGFRFFSATLAATTLASLLIDVFDALPVATNDLLLAAFAGGAMNAVGISLIFKAGAT
ncbi:MAG: YitT family protein, partial [Clostridiales bacterium]|nr:YitT family protein [Clostridiales bacterium]